MELNVTRESVRINETVYEGYGEESVESDIRLPDYCPDIARILKTEITPRIQSKRINGEKLMLEGTALIRILYVPEEGQTVRSMLHLHNFSRVFDMKTAPGDAQISVKMQLGYQNCRVLSPRKLEVKAALGINAKVYSATHKDMISSAEGGGVELLKKPIAVSQVIGFSEKQFKLTEMLELGSSKPPVSSIVKYDAVVLSQEFKVISNKVITKGEVIIKIAYVSEMNMSSIEIMEYTLPISQIIDLDGVDDDCSCNVTMEVVSFNLEMGIDSDGQNRSFDVEVEICAATKAYRSMELQVASDAYSTKYETQVETAMLSFEKQMEMAKVSNMYRESIDLSNTEVSSIIDVSGSVMALAVNTNLQAMMIDAKLSVSMLTLDPEGRMNAIENELPVSLRYDMKADYGLVSTEVNLQLVSIAYSMNGMDKVDIRAEIMIEAAVFSTMYETIITGIEIMEPKENEKSKRKALTLYFADKGEKIWDIAKRYNTSMDAVKNENGLEIDELTEHAMLLIPSVQNTR